MKKLWLIALLFALGCDEDPVKAKFAISILEPTQEARFTCGDDLDKNTSELIERDILISVSIDENQRINRTVALVFDPPITQEIPSQEIPPSQKVVFSAVPFTSGNYKITAELRDGDQALASSATNISVVIDATDPNCILAPASLSFLAPQVDGAIKANADKDGDLSNGIQIDVSLEAEGKILNNLVELRLDDQLVERKTLENNIVIFNDVRLPLEGNVVLKAIAQSPQGLISQELALEIDAKYCELSVTPQPTGNLCDLSAVSDIDPAKSGLQVELTAQSTCDQVEFTVNSQKYQLVEVDQSSGQAKLVVTLNQGENLISAKAQSSNGQTQELPTYALNVETRVSTIDFVGLNQIGVNRFSLDQANSSNENNGTWRFSGTTTNIPANTLIQLSFTPDFNQAPMDVMVDESGNFSFDLSASYACEYTMLAQIQDACGGILSTPVYSFCLDAITPEWQIATPANGALLTLDQDIDPSMNGLQINMAVSSIDPRPSDVDYAVEVACATAAIGPFQVVSLYSKLRSELNQNPNFVVTFDQPGFYYCKVQANTGINEANFPVSTFQIITSEPLFTVVDPVINQTSQQCFNQNLLIGGLAQRINANQTVIEYEILGLSGEAISTGRLDLVGESINGEGRFAKEVDLSSLALEDGNYLLKVRGVSDGIIMSVLPRDPVAIKIDRNLAQFDLITPDRNQVLGLSQDSNQNLQDCVQTPLEIQLNDLVTKKICYTLNNDRPVCGEVNENGVLRVNTVNLLPGRNQVILSVLDCGLTLQNQVYELVTEGCSNPFRINQPVNQSLITPDTDTDTNTDGIQTLVAVEGAPIQSMIQVVVKDLSNGQEQRFDANSDDQGNAQLTITLDQVQQDRILELYPVTADLNGLSIRITQSNRRTQLQLSGFEGECLGLNTVDESSVDGIQIRMTADAQNLSPLVLPTLSLQCGDQMTIIAQGHIIEIGNQAQKIEFNPITLGLEGQCQLIANAQDVNGQNIQSIQNINIDLSSPEITITRPILGATLNRLNDSDGTLAGIQVEASATICNAVGQVSFNTNPSQPDGDLSFDLMGESNCEELSAGLMTFVQGSQELIVSAQDQCGNIGVGKQIVDANEGTTLLISEPRNQARIVASEDLSANEAGCQIQLTGGSTGYSSLVGLRLAVCATNELGVIDPLCGNGVDISRGNCQIRDAEARSINCTISLSDGVHELTLVSTQNNNVISSDIKTVSVDCTAPSISNISIVEDVDNNSCIHQQERSNRNSISDSATMNIRFESSGLEDNQTAFLRALPSNQILTSTLVRNNAGQFPAVTLAPGDYQLYIQASDRNGNPLPSIDQPNIFLKNVSVDTTPPVPVLISPMPNQCLPLSSDARPAQNGYQALISLVTGAQNADSIELTLKLDNVIVQRTSTMQSELSFNPQTITEGAHQLQVLAQDRCGNVGSVAGFQVVGGVKRWDLPNPVSISVDTQIPTITLAAISNNQRLQSTDDADQNSSNGFQIDVSTTVSGLEQGSELQFFSGNQRLITTPQRVLVSNQNTVTTRLTLPPGIHAIQVKSSDACGNPAQSQIISIFVDISGCTSAITSLSDGAILGSSDGLSTPQGLQLNLQGKVDLLDPSCSQATVDLIDNQANVIATTTVNALDGTVSFNNAVLPAGNYSIGFNVKTGQQTTPSPLLNLFVDLSSPNITFSSPFAANNGIAMVINDENATLNGQQISVLAQLNEAQVVTARTASLLINGIIVRDGLAVDPQSNTQIRFNDVDVLPGLSTLEICVDDLARNHKCVTQQIDADSAIPGTVNAVAQITSNRTTEVLITFIAPADDGNTGTIVSGYELRYALTNILNETQWSTATVLSNQPATANPGEQEAFILSDLPPNENVFLAIRAKDNANRYSAVNAVNVDLRLSKQEFTFSPINAASWNGSTFDIISDNALHAAGDFNADGFDDMLVFGSQSGSESVASLILGNQQLAQARKLNFSVPGSMSNLFFGVSADHLGDINGDGAEDIGILGYTSSFSGSALAIYFGCVNNQACLDATMTTADVVIAFDGVLRSTVRGVGNVLELNAPDNGIGDIFVGGGVDAPPAYNDLKSGLLIAGRRTWPNAVNGSTPNLSINSTTPATNSNAVKLSLNEVNAGAFAHGVGDLDNDGDDEMILSGGGNFERSYIFKGGNLTANIENLASNSRYQQVVNPCTERGVANFGSYYLGGRDFDGDGLSDFIVGNRSNKMIALLKSDQSKIDCMARSEDQFGVLFDFAGDINQDGEIDFIATHNDVNSNDAWVFYNNGLGIFGKVINNNVFRKESLRISEPTQKKLAITGVGDMNQDGLDDFAALTFSNGLFRVNIYY